MSRSIAFARGRRKRSNLTRWQFVVDELEEPFGRERAEIADLIADGMLSPDALADAIADAIRNKLAQVGI